MGKRSDIVITWLTKSINEQSNDLDIRITDYLIEREFVEYIENSFYDNVLGRSWKSPTIRFLDKGRKLKDCGSIEEFDRISMNEERLKILLNRTVLRNYWINLCLAISTGIAALYYIWQFLKEYWTDYEFSYPRFWIFVLGICTGVLGLLIVQKVLNRK